jgi:membrane protein
VRGKPSLSKIFKDTVSEWIDDKAFRLSAALAYYSIFSLAPLLVIVGSIAGTLFGEEAVRGQLQEQIAGLVGTQGAETIQSMVKSVSNPQRNFFAGLIGWSILLIGAGGVFGQLKDALNTIWEVQPKPGRAIWRVLKERFLSFTMVLGVGFLLLVSLVVTTSLAAFTRRIEVSFPLSSVFWMGLNLLISFAVVTLLFAMIFKVLPDVKIKWGDVWIGAATTALLFDIGKFLLGFYLGRESMASSYGAAGAVIIILLWVYYASLILLFGAEFTQVYARARGRKMEPKAHAMLMTPRDRLREGIEPVKKKA